MNNNSPKAYMVDVPSIGNLYLDEILVDYEYPLLTVLKNRLDDRYLCLCYTVDGEYEDTIQKWVIAHVSNEELKRLLRNEIGLATPFKNRDALIILAEWAYKTRLITFAPVSPEEVSTDKLPDDDEFLDADPGDWDEYIAKLDLDDD